MRTAMTCVLALVIAGGIGVAAFAQSDTIEYHPKFYDPVLEEMEAEGDSLEAIKDSITSTIRKRQKSEKEVAKETKRELRFDVSGIPAPESPDDFEAVFHFPPVRQYATGTCWSFSSTSFIESEVYRQTGQRIKLSEMHTVYYEYLRKARRYVRERGEGWNGQGSEANAVITVMNEHGAVPLDVYTGLQPGVERHNHYHMSREIRNYLEYCKNHDYWDEDAVIDHVRLILNHYIGEPPTEFEYNGATYTPVAFVDQVLKLNLDDYVDVVSTLSFPFYSYGPFEVRDNWWFDSTYYNLPLSDFYRSVKAAIEQGYSVELGGDVSEPGWYGKQDLSVVPDFDLPQEYINQDSREFRFYNRTTGDDHGVHLVGYTEIDGRDWFLIKDSGSSARWGEHDGYSFMRDDYLRLKMLCYTVHRDVLESLLTQAEKPTLPEE
ncbi:MAG: peptidase C1 [candidate division Zixibacteria bacterium]|nr:peptidase C1 [candidate division Zixibacteria bacterium]